MEQSIQNVKEWLNSEGAVIGHVKGYVKETQRTRAFSTVGAELNVTDKVEDGSVCAFAAIVFGPTEDELKAKVLELFAGLV